MKSHFGSLKRLRGEAKRITTELHTPFYFFSI